MNDLAYLTSQQCKQQQNETGDLKLLTVLSDLLLRPCSHFLKRPGGEIERDETWIMVVPKRKVRIFETGVKNEGRKKVEIN